MTFNLNEYVWVKLTDIGRAIYNKDHDELIAAMNRCGVAVNRTPLEEDGDGWSRWQMWRLMRLFGSHILNSREMPFEMNVRFSPPFN